VTRAAGRRFSAYAAGNAGQPAALSEQAAVPTVFLRELSVVAL